MELRLLTFIGPDSLRLANAAYAASRAGRPLGVHRPRLRAPGRRELRLRRRRLHRAASPTDAGLDPEPIVAAAETPDAEVRGAGHGGEGRGGQARGRLDAELPDRPDRRRARAARRELARAERIRGADRRRDRLRQALRVSALRRDRLTGLAALLSLAGLAVAGYLTYVHYEGIAPVCTTGGCEKVQSSVYAELGGIPVALIGRHRIRPDRPLPVPARRRRARRHRRADDRRLRLQPLPDLSRAVRDRRDLPVVRGQRDPDDGAARRRRAQAASPTGSGSSSGRSVGFRLSRPAIPMKTAIPRSASSP